MMHCSVFKETNRKKNNDYTKQQQTQKEIYIEREKGDDTYLLYFIVQINFII